MLLFVTMGFTLVLYALRYRAPERPMGIQVESFPKYWAFLSSRNETEHVKGYLSLEQTNKQMDR